MIALTAYSGSDVTISGGLFQLDGVPIAAVSMPGQSAVVDVPEGVLLSGVLANGTPFAFHTDDDDRFGHGYFAFINRSAAGGGADGDHRVD